MINTDDRIFDEGLTANEGWLLQFITSKINEDGEMWWSNKKICQKLGWSMVRLQTTKEKLVKGGYLQITPRFNDDNPSQTSNLYKILTPLTKNYTPTSKLVMGGTSNLGMAPTLKSGNQEVLISEVLTTESNTPAVDIRLTEDDFLKKEKNTVSEAAGGPGSVEDLQGRMERFKEDVLAIGGATYTLQMLNAFINYYSQSNNAKKPKMKWEILVRKGWEVGTQLEAWAERNYSRIPCYLTPDQKTITEKRQAFAKSLEPYMKQYGREFLLVFYRHWSVPENVPDPQYLRWEKEPYWDLATCLADRFDRNSKPKPWAIRNNFASNGTRDHQTRNRDLRFDLTKNL